MDILNFHKTRTLATSFQLCNNGHSFNCLLLLLLSIIRQFYDIANICTTEIIAIIYFYANWYEEISAECVM